MNKAKKILNILKSFYRRSSAWKEVKEVLSTEAKCLDITEGDFYDPFKNLIIGILSQNTSDKNSARAYIGLVKKVKRITLEVLSKLSEKEISDAIKVGGLYNLKAKRIKMLVDEIRKKYGDASSIIVHGDPQKTRERLLELPGIGPKTADVFIAYCLNYGVIPIDTNIARVVKRIGLVPKNANYEEIKERIEKEIEPNERVRMHELLIRLGRDFCKAKTPLCNSCPISSYCKKLLK